MAQINESRIASDEASARDEQEAREALRLQVVDYLTGLPRFNIGALFLPPIWGPAHGLFATLLWYPVWLFADNCIYSAYSLHTPFAIAAGVLSFIILAVFTFYFSYRIQPQAAIYCIEKGLTKEQFQRRQRIWAVVSVVIGLCMIAFATYYNLCLRAPMGA